MNGTPRKGEKEEQKVGYLSPIKFYNNQSEGTQIDFSQQFRIVEDDGKK